MRTVIPISDGDKSITTGDNQQDDSVIAHVQAQEPDVQEQEPDVQAKKAPKTKGMLNIVVNAMYSSQVSKQLLHFASISGRVKKNKSPPNGNITPPKKGFEKASN